MIRRLLLGTALVSALVFAAACGDDDDKDDTPTTAPTSATTAAVTSAATTAPTKAATATKPAATTGAATATPGAPDADGTVDPLGGGDTTTKTVKANPDPLSGVVTLNDLRLGVHPELGGWERIVFEVEDANRPPATIEYTDTASQCGSGEDVTLEGEAILLVTIRQAQAHDDQGKGTIDGGIQDAPLPAGATVIKSGKQICDFEGVVQWAFGTSGEKNFKVSTLEDPTRIVIDIKQ
jgi:hypothetical protein